MLIKVKEQRLQVTPSQESRVELSRAEVELTKYFYIEEEYWKQKAGKKWFKHRDRNRIFFHLYVK